MKTPGINVRPLVNMAGHHEFNEVFFENVRVPRENLVGEEHRGWYIGAQLLDFERSNIATAAKSRRALADRYIELHVPRLISYRVAEMQSSGYSPTRESSMTKIFHSELAQRMAQTAFTVLGMDALRHSQTREQAWDRRWPINYMVAVPGTIAGGSNEIQRNVVAMRGLGLPRG